MEPFERLVLALTILGVSPAELARRLGVHRSAVSHWTTGHRKIDNDLAQRIGGALGIRAAWLAFGDGEMLDESPPSPPPKRATTQPHPPAKKPGLAKTKKRSAAASTKRAHMTDDTPAPVADPEERAA